MDKRDWVNKKQICLAEWLWCICGEPITIKKVIRYIENQEQHHSSKSFKEEYVDFLKAYQIDYEERYIFE